MRANGRNRDKKVVERFGVVAVGVFVAGAVAVAVFDVGVAKVGARRFVVANALRPFDARSGYKRVGDAVKPV